jgi:hypothetical protein
VSGADVRDRMQHLARRSEFLRAVHVIRSALKHVSVAKFFKNKYRAVEEVGLDSSRHVEGLWVETVNPLTQCMK